MGKLRSHANKQIADAAKELVKKWKTEVEQAKLKAAPKTPGKLVWNGRLMIVKSDTPTPVPTKVVARTAKTDEVKVTDHGDVTRNKCVELLYDGLAVDSGARKYLMNGACTD